MKFSVVTISFNQGQYLEEALNSVVTQDYPELEYIVVDPGSTDGSRETIDSFRDRLAHVVFEPDQGAPDGLNKGFSRATGEIFAFLNSDDILLPGAIQSVSRVFQEHPECDIVMGDGFIVDGGGQRIRHICAAGFTSKRYFYGAATWLQQATFFRREVFASVGGFNAANLTCWDGELMVEMARNGARIRYLRRDLALFRVHPRSITGSKRHHDMMRMDRDRMFARAWGRRWTGLDTARTCLFRIERLLRHPGALESALKGRLYKT